MSMYNPFKSRTNWTAVAVIVINIGNALVPVLPPLWAAVVSGVLGVLVILFHTDTAIKAGATN